MKIVVCIGSSCHLKGSRQIVEQLQTLIAQNDLKDKVDLGGTFCLGNCQQGVCVTIDGEMHSVTPDTVKTFFDTEILAKVG
jgi:NADH:ubiquinone oxidoreductase subunit E